MRVVLATSSMNDASIVLIASYNMVTFVLSEIFLEAFYFLNQRINCTLPMRRCQAQTR